MQSTNISNNKNLNIKFSFIYGPIHFKIFTFLGSSTILYIILLRLLKHVGTIRLIDINLFEYFYARGFCISYNK